MIPPMKVDDTLLANTERPDRPMPSGSDGFVRGTIIGRYMVLGRLGAGAMGVVYAAYDPELDRRVALKLLLPNLSNEQPASGRTRLLREAQALAKLSHPNVVAVHDVGTYGDGVWVAMELVIGETLAEWGRERGRTWLERLRVLTEAARGVAAAHEAGLVHRDLKPENVMVGSDGRLRVMDFGLAHGRILAAAGPALADTLDSDSKARPEIAALALRLTQMGSVQGTPAYMAPEQWLGQEAEKATDQFGCCVMAWELFFGERPFAGETIMALAANVVSGQKRPPPRGSDVPGWLRRILERGLSTSVSQRWPSMDALLSALGRGMRRAQLWHTSTVIAGLSAVIFGAIYYLAPRQSDLVSSCHEVSKFEEILSSAQRDDIRRALIATGVAYAPAAAESVVAQLDDYGAAWNAEHIAACEDKVLGAQSGHIVDLRNVCLSRRKDQAKELIDILIHADESVVEHAVQAVASLPEVAVCGNVEQLLAAAPLPQDSQIARRVEEERRHLARATSLEATGRFEEGLLVATAARQRARALRYAPLDAEAALVEGSLLMVGADPEAAEAALDHAMSVAVTQDLHAVAAEAAAKRLFVLSDGLGRYAEGLVTRSFAEALVDRAGGDGRLSALLNNNLGAAYDAQGDPSMALASYERARQILESSAAQNPLITVVHHNMAAMYFDQDQYVPARKHYIRALELCHELLGDGHPLSAHPLAGLGDVDFREGATLHALQSYSASLALMETSHGTDHLYLIHPLTGLGRVYSSLGRDAEARVAFERAVAIADRFAAKTALFAEALEGLAALAREAGDPVQARALSERAASIHATTGRGKGTRRPPEPSPPVEGPIPLIPLTP